ncbi:MAG: uncharacterized protein JWP00_3674 [Chloroflexi bacterium]|nr:uncharacterized protein [Chloroflexota bacterium]
MRTKGTIPVLIVVFSLLVLLLSACGETKQGSIVPFASGGEAAAATIPDTQDPAEQIKASLPQSPTAAVAAIPTPEPTLTPVPTATPVPPTATAIPTPTQVPPTATAVPTPTRVPPTATRVPPTPTKVPPTATPTKSVTQAAATGGKWIDVDLTTQKLVAYEGNKVVYTSLISSGTAKYKTVTGNFNIYLKYVKQDMKGGEGKDAYDLPDVPYVMYFYQDYAIHGAYWHNNFGRVMSHGCVNTPTGFSKTLYNWAPMGTPVKVHY